MAWLRVDTQTILTIASHVITKNHRIGVTHSDHRTWYLHVREVRETDRGWYMCQINTDPMKSQVGYLEVVGEWTSYMLLESGHLEDRRDRRKRLGCILAHNLRLWEYKEIEALSELSHGWLCCCHCWNFCMQIRNVSIADGDTWQCIINTSNEQTNTHGLALLQEHLVVNPTHSRVWPAHVAVSGYTGGHIFVLYWCGRYSGQTE